jgi:glycosyltransferase involved in cell wall biosynthesis
VDLTIAIATFGDDSWYQLAEQRAVPSAEATGARVLHVHTTSGGLADARNAALHAVDTRWVAYLDADDGLEPGYVE